VLIHISTKLLKTSPAGSKPGCGGGISAKSS
jgi:hypothetical protein